MLFQIPRVQINRFAQLHTLQTTQVDPFVFIVAQLCQNITCSN